MQIYQKQARRRTDAQIAQITNQILDTYRESLKSIDAELQALYAKHLVGVDPANYYNEAIKFERLTKLKAQVTAQYTAASVRAGRSTLPPAPGLTREADRYCWQPHKAPL